METIRDYIETMFRNLDQTEKVLKAKQELLQMMEDKYEELISEGKTENEAVGTVISEFGNLDELAEELGIGEELNSKKTSGGRILTLDEIRNFIDDGKRKAGLMAFSVNLILLAVAAFFIEWGKIENLNVILFFILLAAGVGVRKYARYGLKKWDFVKKGNCSLGISGKAYVKAEQKKFLSTAAVLKATGTIMCILCVLPLFIENLQFGFLFVFLAIGVMQLKDVSYINDVYARILNVESEGVYYKGTENIEPVYAPESDSKAGIAVDIVKTVVLIALLVAVVFGGLTVVRTVKNIRWLNSQNVNINGADFQFSLFDAPEKLNEKINGDFSSINVYGNVIGVTVKTGKEYRIEARYNHEFLKPEFEIEGDTLYVTQLCKKNYLAVASCDVILTVPKGTKLDDLSITNKTGEIDVSGFDFDTADFQSNVGNVKVRNCNFNNIDARSNVGNVELDINERIEDFTVDVNTNVGDIKIFNHNYEKPYHADGSVDEKMIYVETNVGDVKIW